LERRLRGSIAYVKIRAVKGSFSGKNTGAIKGAKSPKRALS
jgi:hypothetical protein